MVSQNVALELTELKTEVTKLEAELRQLSKTLADVVDWTRKERRRGLLRRLCNFFGYTFLVLIFIYLVLPYLPSFFPVDLPAQPRRRRYLIR